MSAPIAKPTAKSLRSIVAKGSGLFRSHPSATSPTEAAVLALVLTAATLALRIAMDDPLAGRPSLIVFAVPIMLSAYLGGMRGGLLATAFAMLGASYYLLPPDQSFAVAAATDRWQLFFVALCGVVISALNESLHRARRHADTLSREHRAAEESLRKEREFLHALVENVGDAIVSCDANGVLTFFNQATREFHGLPGAPIPADQWAEHFDLYLPDGVTQMPKEQIPLFRALNDDSVRDAEMVIAPKGGPARRVFSSGQAFYDVTGAKTGAVVMHDITNQRRAEEALRVQAHILNHIGQAVIATDLGGRISYVNRFAGKLYGLPPDEMIGQNILNVTVPQVSRGVAAQIIGQLERGEDWNGEFTVRRQDGTEFPAWVTNTQLRDSDGAVCGIVGISEDITDRKLAADQIRESERRFTDMLGNLELVSLMMDCNARITWCNAYLLRLTGWSREEVIGRDLFELFIPPELAGKVREVFTALLADQAAAWHHVNEILTRSGSRRLISWNNSALRSASGEVIGTASIGEDITERKRAEEALRASERKLEEALKQHKQILDKSLDVICTLDAEGRFSTISAACEKLFGYSPAEMVGRPFLEFMPEEDRALASAAVTQLPERKEIHDYETRYVRKDGAIVTISWSATWSDPDRSIFCVGRDCTERKRLEEAQAAQLVAERANVAKSEFLSRMSHELRTPMNAILGFAQVLETEDGLNAEQRDSVDHILKGGAHLLKLINEVLDITSIESGRMTISSEAIALPGLLAETVSLLRPMSLEFGVRVSVLPGESGQTHVQADRQRLKQVFLNLLGNAIKYNRAGGSVTVRYHAATASSDKTHIAITDTGAGLDAAKLSGLFQPFERLGAEQTHIEGTGLGLVLAKRMVEHMGGTLGVDSVLGEGSTFWIELRTAEPPAEGEEPAAEAIGCASLPKGSTERQVVLSIEDNPSNIRLITRILARRPSIHLINAETGAAGLRMAREFQPHLILLDLHLPDSDGHRVIERLAADPCTAGIPVVVITANALVGNREKLLTCGAAAFLTKPLDVRSFLAVVDEFLNSSPEAVTAPNAEA